MSELSYTPTFRGSDEFPEIIWASLDGESVAYFRERTCHNTSRRLDESRFHCSECEFGCWVRNVADGRDKLPSFCPNRGAKVERGDV